MRPGHRRRRVRSPFTHPQYVAARARGSFSRCLSGRLPVGVIAVGTEAVESRLASPFGGLRDRLAFSRLSLSISPRSAVCICQKSGRRVPTGDRLTTGQAVNEGRVAAMGSLFVWHRQRLSRVVQLKPPSSPSVVQEPPSGMWPAIPCDGFSLRRRMVMVTFQNRHPFLARGTAHESHTIPRLPRTWFQFPSFPPHQSPTKWFQPVKHPGSPEDASHQLPRFLVSCRGTCSTYPRWEPGAVRSP
jgi:hypothetical protein